MKQPHRLEHALNRHYTVVPGTTAERTADELRFLRLTHEALGVPLTMWTDWTSFRRLFEFVTIVQTQPRYWSHDEDRRWLCGLWDLYEQRRLGEWRAIFRRDPLGAPHPYEYAWWD